MHESNKNERWVGEDFWEVPNTQTGIKWDEEMDLFPQCKMNIPAEEIVCPKNTKLYFSPPFIDYLKHFKNAIQQFDPGKVSDILLVMFRSKWEGNDDSDGCIWIQNLKKERKFKVINHEYAFFKPDGTQCFLNKKKLRLVHLYH